MTTESACPPADAPPPPPATDPTATADTTAAPLVLRPVATLAEYQECVAIQEETWGAGFSERVPASLLLVAQKLGGVVAAAFAADGRMQGFVFGLTGVAAGRLVHWSDLLAVRPEARGTRIGERLKRYQRDLVRPLGVGLMRWTFDPLVARNAHLNLERLGARAAEYLPNMYGTDTRSPLHGGIATDRLLAEWDLDRDGAHAAMPDAARAPLVVDAPAPDALPRVDGLPDAAVVRIAIPRDVHALPIEHRAAWRAATREAFLAYLGRGYRVVGFRRGDGRALPYYALARHEA